MRPLTWLALLRDGRFRCDPSRWGVVVGVSLATPINTVLAGIQRLVMGRKLATAELHAPPVFIVGHWRSGTTLLHELMVRDERLSSPSTFQCFAPHHFLVSEWFFRRFASWLIPGKRPMDNMDAGWDRPQEDEFALLNLGLPSPYRRIAFARQPAVNLDYLSLDEIDDNDRQRWMDALRQFMTRVSVATGRPLVIKSPTHTGRVGHLAKEFPDAKFIHITRDPRSLFPSTCRLWRSLDDVQGLQRPDSDPKAYEPYAIECLQKMYSAFNTQRPSVAADRIIDVRYEDLVASPVETLRKIYETLRLSDFDPVEPVIQKWVEEEHKDYVTNKHAMEPETEAMLLEEWNDYFVRYGYEN